MRLSELNTGDTGVIVKVLGHGAFRKRVIEMGFVKGRPLEVLQHAPLKDPIKYRLMGYDVSLRASEAHLIEVVKLDVPAEKALLDHDGTPCVVSHEDSEPVQVTGHSERHTINVALIGNPNCGKTSLFNIASGGKERVGNYSGVTVDAKTGHFHYQGYTFNIVDLPGTYSLTSYSPEELYVRQYLREESPDVIINVADATNLERNLYLTTELIDMDRSMVIALNIYDELEKKGVKLDYKLLGEMIGVPMVPIVAKTGKGIHELFETVIKVYEDADPVVRHVHVPLGQDIESAVRKLTDAIKADGTAPKHFAPRYIAIKLLEDDEAAKKAVEQMHSGTKIQILADSLRGRIETLSGDDISSLIASEKYGFIAGALAETMQTPVNMEKNKTAVIDSIVTNRLFGFPIFLAVMFFIFWATFFVGKYPMDWIESAIGWLSSTVSDGMPDGIIKDMVCDGLIGGVGGVIVFLPNILILYYCISFMEDSGYMARAAFIMDKIMHKLGLHGKSFIPLVMGFGCNVPAIMSARAIESRSSRIITILINPFISCSARLPLFVMLIGAFFPSHGALVLMAMYVLGIIVGAVTARLLRKFFFKKDETPFVMELPPYRIPTIKASVRHTWGKGVEYLKKMGGTILVASLVVWALNYFPRHNEEYDRQKIENVSKTRAKVDDSKIDTSKDSYLEMMGKAVNPVLEPLGFHWKATVAAIAGIPAKEIVVSTLGVLYTDNEAEEAGKIGERLQLAKTPSGQPEWPVEAALSFMVFILLYCPCIATITAIVRETHSWKWGAFSISYNTLVAWLAAFATFHIASIF